MTTPIYANRPVVLQAIADLVQAEEAMRLRASVLRNLLYQDAPADDYCREEDLPAFELARAASRNRDDFRTALNDVLPLVGE